MCSKGLIDPKLKVLALSVLLLYIFTGCGKIIETSWEPHVMSLSCTRNGESMADLPLIPPATSPSEIIIDKGQMLEIREFVCRLLPTTQRTSGFEIAQRNLPEVPENALDIEMRVLGMIHKHFNCFDRKDMIQTEWVPVSSGEWKIRTPGRQWKIEADWDYIKLQVQVRKKGEETIKVRDYYIKQIALMPSSTTGRAAWNVSHNASNSIMDSITGRDDDRPCPEEQEKK